jgi:hypothetical protein
MYEALRLLRDRKLLDEPESETVFRDFELLRMPLEKHEIAKDREFKQPQPMTRYPPNDNASDSYVYDPKSPTRSHIMPFGITERGSITWHAIDARDGSARWIERRWLSDRVLAVWGDDK